MHLETSSSSMDIFPLGKSEAHKPTVFAFKRRWQKPLQFIYLLLSHIAERVEIFFLHFHVAFNGELLGGGGCRPNELAIA